MNNKKLLKFLMFSLVPMALGSMLMQKEGMLSAFGIAIMGATSLSGLVLIAYMYHREKHGNHKPVETSAEDVQVGKTETAGDKSAGNVSPLFAAIVLGVIAIVVIRAFVKGM